MRAIGCTREAPATAHPFAVWRGTTLPYRRGLVIFRVAGSASNGSVRSAIASGRTSTWHMYLSTERCRRSLLKAQCCVAERGYAGFGGADPVNTVSVVSPAYGIRIRQGRKITPNRASLQGSGLNTFSVDRLLFTYPREAPSTAHPWALGTKRLQHL